MPMRIVARLLTCVALAAIAAGCLPIGVKGTSLPYAATDSTAVAALTR
jgi:hypothetical protein